jgi:hypothetical protein
MSCGQGLRRASGAAGDKEEERRKYELVAFSRFQNMGNSERHKIHPSVDGDGQQDTETNLNGALKRPVRGWKLQAGKGRDTPPKTARGTRGAPLGLAVKTLRNLE